jgi:hypothetical protein
MIAAIRAVLKYAFLVLLTLVLSHIIEIRGISISRHVLNGMHLVSGFNPVNRLQNITNDYTNTLNQRMKDIDQGDLEINPGDKKALEQVIQRSGGNR